MGVFRPKQPKGPGIPARLQAVHPTPAAVEPSQGKRGSHLPFSLHHFSCHVSLAEAANDDEEPSAEAARMAEAAKNELPLDPPAEAADDLLPAETAEQPADSAGGLPADSGGLEVAINPT